MKQTTKRTGIFYPDSAPYVPKKELLIFDEIAMPKLSSWLDHWSSKEETIQLASDIEYLAEQGLIYEPELESTHQAFFDKIIKDPKCDHIPSWVSPSLKSYIETHTYGHDDVLALSVEIHGLGYPISEQAHRIYTVSLQNNVSKLYGMYLSEYNNIETTPIMDSTYIKSVSVPNESKGDILNIVLNSISLPNDNTPLEDIVSFRNDEDARHKLLSLRLWMYDMKNEEYTTQYISEKLEYLIHEYEQHMKIQKLKFSSGTLESIIVSTATLVEDIVKLKFEKTAKKLFSIKHRKIHLLEADMNAPGREVAYISNINNKFS